MKYLIPTTLAMTMFLSCSMSTVNAAPASATAATVDARAEEAQIAREYFLKAAFLRYVVKYVEWPEDVLPDLSYNVCIYGEVPSFTGINSVNGKMVNDRAISIYPIKTVEQAKKNCQVLFVSPSEEKNAADIISQLKDTKILTFGDFDNFAKDGGDMNFFIMNNRMALMINPPAVYGKGLKISDKMMKLVSVVPDISGENFD
jgi:hypothetical protein